MAASHVHTVEPLQQLRDLKRKFRQSRVIDKGLMYELLTVANRCKHHVRSLSQMGQKMEQFMKFSHEERVVLIRMPDLTELSSTKDLIRQYLNICGKKTVQNEQLSDLDNMRYTCMDKMENHQTKVSKLFDYSTDVCQVIQSIKSTCEGPVIHAAPSDLDYVFMKIWKYKGVMNQKEVLVHSLQLDKSMVRFQRYMYARYTQVKRRSVYTKTKLNFPQTHRVEHQMLVPCVMEIHKEIKIEHITLTQPEREQAEDIGFDLLPSEVCLTAAYRLQVSSTDLTSAATQEPVYLTLPVYCVVNFSKQDVLPKLKPKVQLLQNDSGACTPYDPQRVYKAHDDKQCDLQIEQGRMLWYVEVELDSVMRLQDACLVVTAQPRHSSGKVGPKGGVVISDMRPESRMIFPQQTFAEDHEISIAVHDEDEATVRWTNLNCEDEEIIEEIIEDVGPLMETEMPENIKEEYTLQTPVPEGREDSVTNLLYQDRDDNWHVSDVDKTDTEGVGEVTVDVPIQRAVSVQSSRRIPPKSARKFGEAVVEAHKVRQVVFFVAVKSKPVLQIHIECCLKKVYENSLCEVRRFNFELITPEEFAVYLPDDKMRVTFYITGDFSLKDVPDRDTRIPNVLHFDISQERSRVQDVLVPTATANVLTGYVELEVEWAKIPARCLIADQDCFRKKLLVCVEQGIIHRERPQSGGPLHRAVDIMERSGTLLDNLDEYLERGLGLSSGTVATLRSKYVDLQTRLRYGVFKWADKRDRATVADLVETLEYKDSFRRLADKLRAIFGIQETLSEIDEDVVSVDSCCYSDDFDSDDSSIALDIEHGASPDEEPRGGELSFCDDQPYREFTSVTKKTVCLTTVKRKEP